MRVGPNFFFQLLKSCVIHKHMFTFTPQGRIDDQLSLDDKHMIEAHVNRLVDCRKMVISGSHECFHTEAYFHCTNTKISES